MLPYHRAQRAIAELKAAVYEVLLHAPESGFTNAEVGRTLGIYMGHTLESEGGGHGKHQGHISRTILGLLEAEDVVVQDPTTRRWRLKRHGPEQAEST